MAQWTKKAAIERMKANTLLQEALQIETRLEAVVREAVEQRNVEGYNRIRTYNMLKNRIEPLVGLQCSKPEIRTWQHHNAVVQTLVDLLPPDDVDLYPKGKPE